MTKIGTVVFLGTLLVSASAAADDFGEVGTFAISAERITSIHHSSVTLEPEEGPGEQTDSATNIALFTGAPSLTTVYSVPRLAADYFVIDNLSVGAALAIVRTTTSEETEVMGTSTEEDGPTLTGFLFAPRVGYSFMFQDNVGIWPKAGFTYVSAGSSTEDVAEVSRSALAVSLDVPLVFVPVEHVAFTAGPSLDLGISGSQETDPEDGETQELDRKATEIGLNVGMTVFF
jgi:hypothetical protein